MLDHNDTYCNILHQAKESLKPDVLAFTVWKAGGTKFSEFKLNI